MAKYVCNGTVMGGKYLGEVEADSPEKAIEKAWELDTTYVHLCHQCAGECEDPQIDRIDVSLAD
jgi:hypothetical protein